MVFEELVARRLNKKICRECGKTNAPLATKCRNCHSKNLRKKNKEPKKGAATTAPA